MKREEAIDVVKSGFEKLEESLKQGKSDALLKVSGDDLKVPQLQHAKPVAHLATERGCDDGRWLSGLSEAWPDREEGRKGNRHLCPDAF